MVVTRGDASPEPASHAHGARVVSHIADAEASGRALTEAEELSGLFDGADMKRPDGHLFPIGVRPDPGWRRAILEHPDPESAMLGSTSPTEEATHGVDSTGPPRPGTEGTEGRRGGGIGDVLGRVWTRCVQ